VPRLTTKSCLTAALLVGAIAPADAQEITLRLRPEEGRTYRLLSVNDIEARQSIMGQTMDNHQVMTGVMAYEILSVNSDGQASVRVTYESMKLQQDGPMGRIEYDSSDPPEVMDEATRAYSVMVGKTFHMKLNADGSVSEVEGMDALMDELLSDMPGSEVLPGMMEDIRDSMEGIFDEKMFETGLGGISFPVRGLSIGDSWTATSAAQGLVPISLTTTWTLSDRRDGVAHLDVRSVVGKGEPEMIKMGPMSMTYDMSGESLGTAQVDETSGWMIRSRLEGTFSGTTTVDMPGMPGGPMTSPMSMTMVTTTELLPGTGN